MCKLAKRLATPTCQLSFTTPLFKMFSLIIVIVSIALVAALAVATLYYGGTSWGQGGQASRAAQILTQGQQVLGAADMFRIERGRWPDSVDELVTLKYLQEVPAVEVQLAGTSEAYPLVGGAHAAGGGATAVWTMPAAGRPTFVLRNAVGLGVCRIVNEKSRGDDGILKKPHTSLSSQCFGVADEELTVVLTKEPGELGTVLAPVEVRAASVPLDMASPEWHRVPSKAVVAGTPPGPVEPTDPDAGATVSLVSGVLPSAIVGVPYSVNLNNFLTIDGQGYSGPGVTWSVVSNGLPNGLFLTSDGFISGTPTFEGTGSLQVSVSLGASAGEQTFQVTAVPLTVSLSTASLPTAQVGQLYSYDFKSVVTSNDTLFSGASASFSATGLPAWLSISNAGVISGTPTSANGAGTSIQVTASYLGASGQRVYTLVVNGVSMQVTKIAAGENHTCAVTTAGGLKCWGYGSFGQLGFASGYSTTPGDVTNLTSGVAGVSVGQFHTCAVTTAGGVKCWGKNDYGQLGDSSTTNRALPTDVVGLQAGVASVSAGYLHTCAVLTSGGAKCWGANATGQLGDNTTTQRLTPVSVYSASNYSSISVGRSHACALTTAGQVKCWGSNVYGQLGVNNTVSTSLTPMTILFGYSPPPSVLSISANMDHVCLVTATGAAKCWGRNDNGQLGDNSTINRGRPVDVVGLTSGVATVAAGGFHSCAMTTEGGLKCWGQGGAGQLGDGGTVDRLTPVAVTGRAANTAGVHAGGRHTCAETTTGVLQCWGYNNYGQVGNASVTNRLTPADISL